MQSYLWYNKNNFWSIQHLYSEYILHLRILRNYTKNTDRPIIAVNANMMTSWRHDATHSVERGDTLWKQSPLHRTHTEEFQIVKGYNDMTWLDAMHHLHSLIIVLVIQLVSFCVQCMICIHTHILIQFRHTSNITVRDWQTSLSAQLARFRFAQWL